MSRSEPITAAEYTYTVLLQPEPEGGFTVTCPTLAGPRDLWRDGRGSPGDGCRGDRVLPREPAEGWPPAPGERCRRGAPRRACQRQARDGMSRRLPACTGHDVLRALERGGFYVHHVKGSHHSLRHQRSRSSASWCPSTARIWRPARSAASSSSASSPKRSSSRSCRRCTDGAGQGMHRACAAFTVDRALPPIMRSHVRPLPPELPARRAAAGVPLPGAPEPRAPVQRGTHPDRADRAAPAGTGKGASSPSSAGAWCRSGPRISRSGAR